MTGSRRPIGEPLRPLRFAYATTEVPADYDHPDTDMLELAVLRAVSTHPNRERIWSMLINPGGPGGSGLDAAVSNALTLPTSCWPASPLALARARALVIDGAVDPPPSAPDAAVKFGP